MQPKTSLPGRIMLCAAVLLVAASCRTGAERPNILWIIAEDMGPDWGVHETAESRTPTLDALAREGMLFTNAFMTASICSTSRSALFTGVHAISIGAHQHRTPEPRKQPLPPGVRLLTDRLRDAGYHTALLTDLRSSAGDAGIGFEGSGKTDWNFRYEGPAYDGNELSALAANQPFFAQVQFPESHRGKAWNEAHTRIPQPADPERVDLPSYYPDHPITRADWAQYLNAVMAFDGKVAVVLAQLEKEGLLDNTIVIVFADHGRAMYRAKQWLYDAGLHVPLVIRFPPGATIPKGYAAGSTDDRLVSGVDLTATTLALAGIDVPGGMHGIDLYSPAATSRRFVYGARDRADETVERIRSVRDERFLYIRNCFPERPYTQPNNYKELEYPPYRLAFRLFRMGALGPLPARFFSDHKPAEELYDTWSDPENVFDLAGDDQYREVLAEMRAELDRWESVSEDAGRLPEPPAVAEAVKRESDLRNQKRRAQLLETEGPWR